MNDREWLTHRFEEQRPHLRAVAYRMLGSLPEADDAVQEAWLRLDRSDTSDVDNLAAWLTTVVARVSLNVLRARRTRREDTLETHLPDLIISRADEQGPEDEALLTESVGLALLVVLETLTPAERLAFVLHDVFALPFDEIASMIDRSPEATRQLASRARRRIRADGPTPDVGVVAQREVVDAFFAAGRRGDFAGLVEVLHRDVVVRTDAGPRAAIAPGRTVGAEAVARRAQFFADPTSTLLPVLVNGVAGMLVVRDGRAASVMGFTVVSGKVVAIDVLLDPDRLARLDLSALS